MKFKKCLNSKSFWKSTTINIQQSISTQQQQTLLCLLTASSSGLKRDKIETIGFGAGVVAAGAGFGVIVEEPPVVVVVVVVGAVAMFTEIWMRKGTICVD